MPESFEEILNKQGTLVFTPKGNSMQPLLLDGENPVVLEKVTDRLQKGDIPFYQRENGQYVLHRVIRVREDSYDCCGDNQSAIETGVRDQMILAKMVGFYRGETYISLDEAWVKRYAKRRMASRPFRRLLALVKLGFQRLFQKSK